MPSAPRKIYEICCSGDAITDTDVKFGMEYYKDMAHDLGQCGPVFYTAWREALRIADMLEGFHNARNRKR
jgi:pyruvate carboxylase